MLVVVAIIALLVAVLVPTLSKAREQANRTVCASHQKQILTGLYTYVSNSKGWLPYSVPAFNASLTWIVEQSFSKPPYPQGYVHLGLLYKNRQIADPKTFFCPSHHEFPHIYPSGWTDFVAGSKNIEHTATSYIYLLNGQVDAYPKGVMLNARLEQFKGRQSLLTCVFLGNSSKKQTARVWPHKAGVNAAYADGSVQLFNLSTSLGDTAAKLYSSGNIGDMDYFTFCMFKLLSGERKWIDAFPQ